MADKHAVIIAVENYQDAGIESVRFAENDACELADALKKHGFDDSTITLVLSHSATKTRLESLFRSRFAGLESDDILFIFYAGHGFAEGGKNYITCHDTVLLDLRPTSIELQSLFAAVRSSKSQAVCLFLDCCHSGLPIDESMRGILSSMTDEEFKRFCKESSFHLVFAASDTTEYSYSSQSLRHGIWSYHVIECLNGNAEDALERRTFLTASSLQNYLSVQIPRTLRKVLTGPRKQTPRLWGNMSREAILADFRPFKVTAFTPFQVSMINLDEFIAKRREFTTEEWIDALMNSCGLDPAQMNRRQKLLYLCRCIPLTETNVNMVELAPRETGKTYLYRNVSYYAHVLSGGKATPAQLFINLNTGKIGEVGTRDAVVFDEIANTDFTDPKAFVSIMQGYMQDSKFSRGKREMLAFASLIFVGNLDVQGGLPHEKYYHLFEPLPDFLQVLAFLDRIHAYLPGWEIPKLKPSSYSKNYGFITDYFCEIMHELRKVDLLGSVRTRFELSDFGNTAHGVSGRDQRAVMKTASGLLKLLYPDGTVTDAELEEVLNIACELRQRVREQLHLMAPGEYDRIKLGIKMQPSGKEVFPTLPDSERVHRVTLPETPSIGEVVGLAVSGDHGCILRFEMQATKGSGRIVPLGSIQRVMRESIEAAAQFIKAKHADLGIDGEWRHNFDVAVLATYMGIPKEGPSAGITIATGIVSALKRVPVRNDLAMTGEITIMGKVLPVGGIQQKVRAAFDAGVKEVLLPAENLKEAELLPSYIIEKIKLTPVTSIEEVIALSFLLKECAL